jgi:O-antigen ligase
MSEMMIITSLVLPAMLTRATDMWRSLFLCFAFTSILNACFVLGDVTRFTVDNIDYHRGYMSDKNALGQVEAIALLLAFHEILHPGLRRTFGIIVAVTASSLLVLSHSKTSLGLAIFVPFLATLILVIAKSMRISPALVLFSIGFFYVVLSNVIGLNVNKLSWYMYGNYTLSARTLIWDFVNYEIGRRPLLGWGYQSFWLIGPDGPATVDAWGWIKSMPHAHNGYLDTEIDGGIVGLAFLVTFILATVHGIGRLAEHNRVHAWLVLSLALFVVADNFLESSWMRPNVVWMVFVIVAVEIGRYWLPFRPGDRSHRLVGRHRGDWAGCARLPATSRNPMRDA